jgi:hypothetical protein
VTARTAFSLLKRRWRTSSIDLEALAEPDRGLNSAISTNSATSVALMWGVCMNSGIIQMMRKLKHNFVDHDRRPVLPGCGVAEPRAELAAYPMLKTIQSEISCASRPGAALNNLSPAQRNWDSRNITGISASVILVKPGALADPVPAPIQRTGAPYPKTDFEMNTCNRP